MANIFISGAAHGLGLGFLIAYAAQIHDDPSAPFTKASKLYILDRVFPSEFLQTNLPYEPAWLREHVVLISADVTSHDTLEKAVEASGVSNLALVVHSVGVRGLVPSVPVKQYSDVAKAESLDVMDADTMRSTFEINAMGTFFLLRLLLPALREYAAVNPATPPKVAVMGSRMGSVGHNTELGNAYAYRASKAALNAIVKSLSIDVKEVIWTIIHPGRVETALVQIKEDDAMPVEESVRDLLSMIQGFSRAESGRFVDRFGEDIQW